MFYLVHNPLLGAGTLEVKVPRKRLDRNTQAHVVSEETPKTVPSSGSHHSQAVAEGAQAAE